MTSAGAWRGARASFCCGEGGLPNWWKLQCRGPAGAFFKSVPSRGVPAGRGGLPGRLSRVAGSQGAGGMQGAACKGVGGRGAAARRSRGPSGAKFAFCGHLWASRAPLPGCPFRIFLQKRRSGVCAPPSPESCCLPCPPRRRKECPQNAKGRPIRRVEDARSTVWQAANASRARGRQHHCCRRGPVGGSACRSLARAGRSPAARSRGSRRQMWVARAGGSFAVTVAARLNPAGRSRAGGKPPACASIGGSAMRVACARRQLPSELQKNGKSPSVGKKCQIYRLLGSGKPFRALRFATSVSLA